MTEKALSDRVAALIRPELLALKAYHVPDDTGLVKLDAMENPYRWPPEMLERWLAVLRDVSINRYPDAGAAPLKSRLRAAFGLPEQQGILLGNGSDELIQILTMALAAPGRCVMAPEPAFVMYRMISTFLGMQFAGVPLDASFDIDEAATLEAIAQQQPVLIFLAMPNNPTGNLFSTERVEKIIAAAPGLVILDEAYTAFTDADYLDWAQRYDNVLVMRTLSKVGLAGLRLGILMGNPVWIDELEKLRMPYNINALTQASACFALDNFSVLREQSEIIRRERCALQQSLAALPLKVWPSEANFILVQCLNHDAPSVAKAMKDAGVLIKCLHGVHPGLEGALRFTVGSPEENRQLLAALTAALS